MPSMLSTRDINHLFNCSQVPTQNHATSSLKKPFYAKGLIQVWESRLAFLKG